MITNRRAFPFLVAAVLLATGHETSSQSSGPPLGYADIPAGFDFPADKSVLEMYRSQPNIPGQRLHVWNVFGGMTNSTAVAGKTFAVFETWFSENETFSVTLTPLVSSARAPRQQFEFHLPDQFRPISRKQTRPVAPNVEPPGSVALSFVLYNFAAYNHIRTNHLYQQATLDSLAKNGAFDQKIPQNRTIPPFPPGAVVLKTVWWPVAKDKISAMPIWDPEINPPQAAGNPTTTWARYIGIDPTSTAPAGEMADVVYDGVVRPKSHIVGLNNFHAFPVTAEQAQRINSDGLLAQVAQQSFGRPMAAGDYAALVAIHVTTKEIEDWVWATFWWHDKPNDGPFAADRVGSISGVWRNYLMNTSYDLNLPSEADGSPRIAFNPWLEARFQDGGHGGGGTKSNCMNCHNRASTGADGFLPIYRGNPDFVVDDAYAPGSLRTDFLWSILLKAN